MSRGGGGCSLLYWASFFQVKKILFSTRNCLLKLINGYNRAGLFVWQNLQEVDFYRFMLLCSLVSVGQFIMDPGWDVLHKQSVMRWHTCWCIRFALISSTSWFTSPSLFIFWRSPCSSLILGMTRSSFRLLQSSSRSWCETWFVKCKGTAHRENHLKKNTWYTIIQNQWSYQEKSVFVISFAKLYSKICYHTSVMRGVKGLKEKKHAFWNHVMMWMSRWPACWKMLPLK